MQITPLFLQISLPRDFEMDVPEVDRSTEVAKTENEFVGRVNRSKTIDLQSLEC
jgi:hypothetical protein